MKHQKIKMEIQRNIFNTKNRRLIQQIYMSYEIYILTFMNMYAYQHLWRSSQKIDWSQKDWSQKDWLYQIIYLWDKSKNDQFFRWYNMYLTVEVFLTTLFPFVYKNTDEWRPIHVFWIFLFATLKHVYQNQDVMGFMLMIYAIDQTFYVKMIEKNILPNRFVSQFYLIILSTFYLFLFVLFGIEGINILIK